MLEELMSIAVVDVVVEIDEFLDELCEDFSTGCGIGCLGCMDNS